MNAYNEINIYAFMCVHITRSVRWVIRIPKTTHKHMVIAVIGNKSMKTFVFHSFLPLRSTLCSSGEEKLFILQHRPV